MRSRNHGRPRGARPTHSSYVVMTRPVGAPGAILNTRSAHCEPTSRRRSCGVGRRCSGGSARSSPGRKGRSPSRWRSNEFRCATIAVARAWAWASAAGEGSPVTCSTARPTVSASRASSSRTSADHVKWSTPSGLSARPWSSRRRRASEAWRASATPVFSTVTTSLYPPAVPATRSVVHDRVVREGGTAGWPSTPTSAGSTSRGSTASSRARAHRPRSSRRSTRAGGRPRPGHQLDTLLDRLGVPRHLREQGIDDDGLDASRPRPRPRRPPSPPAPAPCHRRTSTTCSWRPSEEKGAGPSGGARSHP
jgi:hypothetical protein